MNSKTLILLVMAVSIAALMVVILKNHSSVPVNTGPKILVASTNISAGEFIRADKNIVWAEWSQANISPSFIVDSAHKIEEFNGAVARRQITAGEPLSYVSIVKSNEGGFMPAVLNPGKRAVSIAVNVTSGNAGFVFPGDHVDLILTHRLEGGMLASETFLEDLRVLAIDQMLATPDNKAVVAKTITLEVSPKEAEKINVAISIGGISVSLRSLSSKSNLDDKNSDSQHENNLSDSKTDANYSTNADVSKLMGDKSGTDKKVSVFHGSSNEQLNFREDKK
ncbi:MAG: Flp pilus assembly protein CpaB [Pseudomonadota bacterium]